MRMIRHHHPMHFLCLCVYLTIIATTTQVSTAVSTSSLQHGRISRSNNRIKNHHPHHQSSTSTRPSRDLLCAFQVPIFSTPNFKFPISPPALVKAVTNKAFSLVGHGVYCGQTPLVRNDDDDALPCYLL